MVKSVKKIFCLILSCVVLSAASFLIFAACSGGKKLDTPKITCNAQLGYISWESVKNAKNYKIIDLAEGTAKNSFSNSTSYYPSVAGEHVITVTAQSDGVKYKNSDPATTVLTISQEVIDGIYGSSPRDLLSAPYDAPYIYHFNPENGRDLSVDLGFSELAHVSALGIDSDEYSFENGKLTLYSQYLSGFKAGATFEAEAVSADGTREKFVLKASQTDVPRIVGNSYAEADRNAASDIRLEFDADVTQYVTVGTAASGTRRLAFAEISLNGEHPAIFDADTTGGGSKFEKYFAFDGKRALIVKKELISLLGIGVNSFTVHTLSGDVVFKINVSSSSTQLYNVNYEYDKYPGKLYVEWHCDYTGSDAEFTVSNLSGSRLSSRSDRSVFENPDSGVWRAEVSSAGFAANELLTLNLLIKGEVKETKYVTFYIPTVTEELYISNTYDYLGETYNNYISDDAELEVFMHHALLYSERPENISDTDGYVYQANIFLLSRCLDPGNKLYGTDALVGAERLAKGITYYRTTYREATKLDPLYGIRISNISEAPNGNAYSVKFKIESFNEASSVPSGENYRQKYTDADGNPVVLQYASETGRAADFNAFAIESVSKTAQVSTSDQLYFAVEKGLKPLPTSGSSAERMYEKAKAVLRSIADDGMTDYQKVRAIFEWICGNVRYDHATVNEMGKLSPNSDAYNKFYGRNCFYLEGVFDDRVAVCNGLAKAFVLMCRIEGIEAVKENGLAGESIEHAWNKVKINGIWYLCDPTWSTKNDQLIRTESSGGYWHITNQSSPKKSESEIKEYYSAKFFLIDEAELKALDAGRKADADDFPANYRASGSYDVYASDIFEYTDRNGKKVQGDHVIAGYDDMTALATYYLASERKEFAVKVYTPYIGADKIEEFESLAASWGLNLQKTCADESYQNGATVVYYRVVENVK